MVFVKIALHPFLAAMMVDSPEPTFDVHNMDMNVFKVLAVIGCDLFEFFVGFLERSFPFFSRETRELWIILTDIFTHAVDLSEWYEELISSGIMEFEIFAPDISEHLLYH